MLRILLRILAQCLCIQRILHRIPRASCRSSNRVDVSLASFDAQVRLWRRSKYTEAPKVEIEEIRGRIDASQSTIQTEVISLEMLFETTGEHHLEHIPTQTVGNPTADIRLVLLIRQCGSRWPHRLKIVHAISVVLDGFLDFFQVILFSAFQHFDKHQFVLEVVEHDDVLIKNVVHVRRIITILTTVLHRDLFKVAHCIERRIAIESAVVAPFAFHMEATQKIGQCMLHAILLRDRFDLPRPIRQSIHGIPVVDTHTGQWTQSDERAVVLTTVIIRTFHQGTLRELVTQFQIGTHRRIEVAQYRTRCCCVVVSFHILLFNSQFSILNIIKVCFKVLVASARDRENYDVSGLEVHFG